MVINELGEEIEELMERGDANKLSAELNTINNLEVNLKPAATKITLLASETYVGELYAVGIQRFLTKKRFVVEYKVVPGLTYEMGGAFERGLIAYSNLLNTTIEASVVENEIIGLIVTGGFKAQIVYSAVIAMLYKFPVIYYNDLFSEVAFLPPLPLKLDREFWINYHDYLRWFEKPRTVEEIQKRMGVIPEDLAFFIEQMADEKEQISALGRILLQLYSSSVFKSYT